MCEGRNDDWAVKVRNRILGCSDLVSVEARYTGHVVIYLILKCTSTSSSTKKGRPKSCSQTENFKKLCSWLEDEGEVYSLNELHEQMVLSAESVEHVYIQKMVESKVN